MNFFCSDRSIDRCDMDNIQTSLWHHSFTVFLLFLHNNFPLGVQGFHNDKERNKAQFMIQSNFTAQKPVLTFRNQAFDGVLSSCRSESNVQNPPNSYFAKKPQANKGYITLRNTSVMSFCLRPGRSSLRDIDKSLMH